MGEGRVEWYDLSAQEDLMDEMGFEWCLERRVGFGCTEPSWKHIPDTERSRRQKQKGRRDLRPEQRDEVFSHPSLGHTLG